MSSVCVDLIGRLLKVEPEKRISWTEFFAHPFVTMTSEQYQELCTKLKAEGPAVLKESPTKESAAQVESTLPLQMAAAIRDLQLEDTAGKEVCGIRLEEEELILEVIGDAMIKAKTLLASFDPKTFIAHPEEICDILWKTCKRLKPIMTFFVPTYKAVMLAAKTDEEYKTCCLKLVKPQDKLKKDRLILNEELIKRLQHNIRFPGIIDPLVDVYDTLITNLVSYSAVLEGLVHYNSAFRLFKYALMVGKNAADTEKRDIKKAKEQYLRALLIVELILSEMYKDDKTFMYMMDVHYKDYGFVNQKDEWLFIAASQMGQKCDINAKVQVVLPPAPCQYVRSIRNELHHKYEILAKHHPEPALTSLLHYL